MKRAILVLLSLFIPALIVTMPLRVGLDLGDADRSGLAAIGADGSIWSGRLADARFGAVPLGDVNIGLKFRSLVAGPMKFAVQTDASSDIASAQPSALGLQRFEEGWRGELSLNRH